MNPLNLFRKKTAPVRSAFAIRCMSYDQQVAELTALISGHFPESPIHYIADQRAGRPAWTGPSSLIPFDEEGMDRLGLFHQRENVAWSCGDYCYSLALAEDWDYLWLLEPDIGFTGGSFSVIVDADATDHDLIGTRIGKRAEHWTWTPRLRAASGEKDAHGVFFPLTRVSRPLAEAIHEFRRSLTPVLAADESLRVPNDESVTATVAHKNGMSTLDLYHEHREIFAHWAWRPKFQRSSLSARAEPLISHPVVSDEDFPAYAQKEITEALRNAPIAKALSLAPREVIDSLTIEW